jgi:hypothetical protein
MTNRTTDTSHCKIYLRLLARLRASCEQSGRRLFAATDATAREHGWQIIPTNGGLGRRYRDPRFDNLASCLRCGGSGTRVPGSPCPTCAGTGRVTLAVQTTDPPTARRSP